MKHISAAVILTLLFGAHIAFAQSVYPTYFTTASTYQQPYGGTYTGQCVNITRNLSVGSRGTDVLQLQQFILTRNYPGAGSWMLTSYYGQATRAGVINFQIDMHISQTGILDAQTRAALTQMTCLPGQGGYNYGQVSVPPIAQYPYNYNNQYPQNPITQPWYNYNSYSYGLPGQGNNYNGNCSSVYGSSSCPSGQSQCGWYTVGGNSYFNNCGANNPPNTNYPYNNYPNNNSGNVNAPTISNVSGPTTLSVNTTGTWIVSLNNNQYNSNYTSVSVNWGDAYNYNGVTPSAAQQVYGTQTSTFTHSYSQAGTYTVVFTVSNGYGSNTSTITVQVGGSNYGTATVSYLTPNSGAIGTSVTVYGTGFSSTNNSVHFGNGVISGINSYNGTSLSFVVPSTLTGYNYNQVTPGTYNVSVTNSSGALSNTVPFTVTSYGTGGNYNAPSITNVSGPTSLGVNTSGTWSVSVNNPYSSGNTTVTVNWGDPVYGAYLAAPQQITGTSQTVTLTHSYTQSGTYTVTFTVSNNNGSNTSTITVQVGSGSTYGAPTVVSMMPTYGSVGTQITIYGTGFNGDNTVHFGNGGKMHVTSTSGNYIYFTVPSNLSPCDVQGTGAVCPTYLQQVTQGQYQIYVTTNGVNSNSLTFTVQ